MFWKTENKNVRVNPVLFFCLVVKIRLNRSVSQTFCGGGRALEGFFKTRILLVGFGYNETNLESFTKLTARSWAGSGRCRGNEARSDHDLAVSLAI